ncbi:hypothetical protein SLEP1_g59921 [Rubroshorea leprosula]|uniref:F-box domain-containing protein n=1 Tax=Rubroshorea leprosula TaxID=152421 RepID=A0AAV5MV38_9ROSI|nr:hypothetical protein SLEP1_g59921 [Rubroshorea leprosula]
MDNTYTKKTKWHEETQMDRLSDLPDCLLHHILSFMDSKYAVQTCILSKRWVSVWTHLPVLKLDSKFFNRVGNFRSFISQVLDHCENSNILTLSICSPRKNLARSLVDKIISFAVSHSVQELDLSLKYPIGELQNVFRCQSLRVLKLDLLCGLPLPNSISLASLKTLILCKVRLKSENHCFDLFSSCLDLQNIVLDHVFLTISDIFNISAPALVSLTISKIIFYVAKDAKIMYYAPIKDRKVVITAPRLTSFSFTCYRPMSLSMDNSPLLENVNLSMSHDDLSDTQEEGSFMFLIEMLRQLGNARSLTVTLGLVKFLSQHSRLLEERPFPFSKLESLKVLRGRQSCKKIPPNVLNFLVQGSPMAKELLRMFQKVCKTEKCLTAISLQC